MAVSSEYVGSDYPGNSDYAYTQLEDEQDSSMYSPLAIVPSLHNKLPATVYSSGLQVVPAGSFVASQISRIEPGDDLVPTSPKAKRIKTEKPWDIFREIIKMEAPERTSLKDLKDLKDLRDREVPQGDAR